MDRDRYPAQNRSIFYAVCRGIYSVIDRKPAGSFFGKKDQDQTKIRDRADYCFCHFGGPFALLRDPCGISRRRKGIYGLPAYDVCQCRDGNYSGD